MVRYGREHAHTAEIGLPAWGEFRDPWFAAFFLHRWPPTRSIRRGRYWPLYEAYLDATRQADEEIQECAELDVTLWLSHAELTEMAEISNSAVELLDDTMDPNDDARGDGLCRLPGSPAAPGFTPPESTFAAIDVYEDDWSDSGGTANAGAELGRSCSVVATQAAWPIAALAARRG